MLSEAKEQSFTAWTIRQYLFKLRAYSRYISGLVLAQILGMLLAYSGSVNGSMGSNSYIINLHTYSAKLIIVFTVIWAFALSILISSRASKDAVFSFPGNRDTDSLSDIAILLTGCLFGAVTTALAGPALRIVLLPFIHGYILAEGFYPVLTELGIVGFASFIYMLVFSAAGYFSGTLCRISTLFIIPIGAVIFFLLYLSNLSSGAFSLLALNEPSSGSGLPITFIWAMLGISILLYALAAVISSRMEVKK